MIRKSFNANCDKTRTQNQQLVVDKLNHNVNSPFSAYLERLQCCLAYAILEYVRTLKFYKLAAK